MENIAHDLPGMTCSVHTGNGQGSAVPVGEFLLTAAHVTPEPRRLVEVFSPEIGGRFEASVAAVDRAWDIAMLRPVDDLKLEGVTVGGDEQAGDPIWHCGYPAPMNLPVLRRGHIAAIAAAPGQAILVDRTMWVTEHVAPTPHALLLDIPSFPGASGGPVVGDDGRLIGLLSRGPRARNYNVPMDIGIAMRIRAALIQTGWAERYELPIGGAGA